MRGSRRVQWTKKGILWGGTRKAVRGLRSGFGPLIPDYARAARAAFTRSGVNGTWRSRAPVASNIALPTAAATTVIEVSPAPVASLSGRLISTVSIVGTPNPKGRVWYVRQSNEVTL